jgi:hypothetical protein
LDAVVSTDGDGDRQLLLAAHDPEGRRGDVASNPLRHHLGVVQPGALADLLLVDGDPLANIKLIEDPAKNFVVIMKDGKIYKNTLP